MLQESFDHIVQLLLNHVVDANAEDRNRNSLLFLASWLDRIMVAATLLKYV